MKHNRFVLMAMCALLLLAVSVPGVFAIWTYFDPPEPVEEELSASMSEWTYPYTITFINNGEKLGVIVATEDKLEADGSFIVDKYDDEARTAVEASIANQKLKFSHWMNAGSTRVDEIPAGNKEDVILYPSFEGVYTAMFVDQDGNVLAWDTFTKNDYSKISNVGNAAQTELEKTLDEDLELDYWEVRVTKNGKTTKTKLSEYRFADDVDVTIYPVCTYNGDVNLTPVDTDGDGDTDEYHVGGYSNPEGQDLVEIPDKVNGIEITAINANAFSSYDGVHSVVIPNTVKTVGGNILAVDWWGIRDKGETVTIYFKGTYEQWWPKEASFPVGWDDGLSGDTRIFFLDENGKVDPSQGYMQAQLKTNWLGTGESLDWAKATVTQALKTEYTGKCDCKTCKASNLDRPDKQYWEGVTIG